MAIEWIELGLDLQAFDERAAAERLRPKALESFTLVTLEQLGLGTEQQQHLFELNRECARDIPDRGRFHTFRQYVTERIDTPTFDPRAIVIALYDGEWVGMAAASSHLDDGFMHDEMTGVLRAFRGRGLALALKVANIRRMRMLGATSVRTRQNAANTAAIALNRSLGYVDR